MRLVLTRRKKPLKYGGVIVVALSLLTGIGVFALFSWSIGVNPYYVIESILTTFIFPGIVKDFLILSLLGYALLIAFKGSLWNIGAEGQMHMAIIASVYVTLILFFTLEKTVPIHVSIGVVLLSIVLATIAGALWGGLAGAIKAYTGVDEVPVTLILNYIAYFIGNILVYGPFRGKYVKGYGRTDSLPAPYKLSISVKKTITGDPVMDTLNGYLLEAIIYFSWIIALIIIAIFTYWLFNKSSLGLKIKILGSNPEYLVTIGVDVKRTTVIAFMLSGAIAGLTGALYYHGALWRLEYPLEYQTMGYGYLAILVTWLSMLDMKFIPISAYIVSALIMGSQRVSSLPVVREAFAAIGLGGAEIAFRLLMFGSILLAYSILRFIQDYEIRVVKS